MPARLRPGLERRLERQLKAAQVGEVRFDAFTRGRYSTDASHYQITPLGVVTPRTIEEADRAIAICRADGVPVTARGGGTSQAGQTVNETLVVDCSRHLNRVVSLDAQARRCVV
ncbi:MAG TPA: FAD-binding protein, partial [Xanthobacteraceae bacterium]